MRRQSEYTRRLCRLYKASKHSESPCLARLDRFLLGDAPKPDSRKKPSPFFGKPRRFPPAPRPTITTRCFSSRAGAQRRIPPVGSENTRQETFDARVPAPSRTPLVSQSLCAAGDAPTTGKMKSPRLRRHGVAGLPRSSSCPSFHREDRQPRWVNCSTPFIARLLSSPPKIFRALSRQASLDTADCHVRIGSLHPANDAGSCRGRRCSWLRYCGCPLPVPQNLSGSRCRLLNSAML